MDKLRLKLRIALVIIFGTLLVGLVLGLVNADDSAISGSAVSEKGEEVSRPKVFLTYLPAILFMGFLIISFVYLERL